MSERPSWQEYALMLANVAKLRSEDVVKVGACALDYENRVLGVAYNGLAPGKTVHPSFFEAREKRLPFMIHAEVNLLSLLKRGECKILASTKLPCSSCAQMIAAYGVQEVIYEEEYGDQKGKEIFDFYNIKLSKKI